MTRYLIIAATSAIAQTTIRALADQTAYFMLIAKSQDKLAVVAADLRVRGATVETGFFDASHPETIPDLVSSVFANGREYDHILVAHGILLSQAACEQNLERTQEMWTVNTTSVILFLTALLPFLKKQGRGHVAVISSVAGDRGRASLAIYGASKAALDAFLEGHRLGLIPFHVGVLTIKPGYVDTPMIAHLPPSPLTRSAEEVGGCIAHDIQQQKTGTVYVPRFWSWIMWVIRWLPEGIFRRLPI